MNTADLIGSRGLLDRGLASIASAIQTYTQNKQRENESARQQMRWELAAKRQDELDAQAREMQAAALKRQAEQDALARTATMANLGRQGIDVSQPMQDQVSVDFGGGDVLQGPSVEKMMRHPANVSGLSVYETQEGRKAQAISDKQDKDAAIIEKLTQEAEALKNKASKPSVGKWRERDRLITGKDGRPILDANGKKQYEKWLQNEETGEWKAIDPVIHGEDAPVDPTAQAAPAEESNLLRNLGIGAAGVGSLVAVKKGYDAWKNAQEAKAAASGAGAVAKEAKAATQEIPTVAKTIESIAPEAKAAAGEVAATAKVASKETPAALKAAKGAGFWNKLIPAIPVGVSAYEMATADNAKDRGFAALETGGWAGLMAAGSPKPLPVLAAYLAASGIKNEVGKMERFPETPEDVITAYATGKERSLPGNVQSIVGTVGTMDPAWSSKIAMMKTDALLHSINTQMPQPTTPEGKITAREFMSKIDALANSSSEEDQTALRMILYEKFPEIINGKDGGMSFENNSYPYEQKSQDEMDALQKLAKRYPKSIYNKKAPTGEPYDRNRQEMRPGK